MKTMLQTFAACLLSVTLSACNTNIFAPVDTADPAEKAAAYLDEGKTDEAISVLNNALQDEPANYQLISLLASAKAQKAGLDTLDIVIRLAENSGEATDAEGNALTSLFAILPDVSENARDLMRECVGLLASIPDVSRTNADEFKATLYNTAFTAMQAKIVDADGDGVFTREEVLAMDDETASDIIDSLLNAEKAAEFFEGEGDDAAAAEAVAEIRAQIDAQDGANTAEKLRKFLETSGQTIPTN